MNNGDERSSLSWPHWVLVVAIGSVFSFQVITCLLLLKISNVLTATDGTQPISVVVTNSDLAVEVKNREVPVRVTNLTPIDVKLYDHYILGGDPIPVRIER